jgi:uncharacterized OB-fold protein
MTNEQKISLVPDRFIISSTDGEPHLLGNRCKSCGEIYFPTEGFCVHCLNQDLEEISLNNVGDLYSFTVVRQRQPGFKGAVPYAVGLIDLPERIRVMSLLSDCDFDTLKIGMKVKLIIDKLYEDEAGSQVTVYKFTPFSK